MSSKQTIYQTAGDLINSFFQILTSRLLGRGERLSRRRRDADPPAGGSAERKILQLLSRGASFCRRQEVIASYFSSSKKKIVRQQAVSNCRFLGLGIFLLIFFLFFSTILSLPIVFSAQNGVDQLKTELNQRLQEIQDKIEVYRGQIKQKESEARTLKREIDILEAQINKTELEIEQTELVIRGLDLEIRRKEKEINKFNQEIDKLKEKLTEYLRTIYEYDQISLSEIILQKENFSDFLDEVQSLENIQAKIQSNVGSLKSLKKDIEDQKNSLEEEKDQYSQLMILQEAQRKSLQAQQGKKNNILQQTKGQETLFKKLIDKASSDVQSIKNQLYLLEGVGLSMTLEEALEHAAYASAKTGVRPAYLLAVLKKESSWGTNVGTGFWRSDMHPRDHQAYLEICKKLGLDPDKMPVSRKPSYGWGGAMGPAQFLPSTWLAYEPEIAKLTGHNPPNPWDINDSFIAAGIKLAQNGANLGTYEAEWKAAMIYFAGKRWNNPVYRFYGDSVMELAAVIQEQVDAIGGSDK